MTPARIRQLTIVLVLLGVMGAAAPASAQTCADNIIDDWADNAQIDGTYPVSCYRAAIQALPEDLRAYSSAADDIRRAQQELIAAQSGGGSDGGSESAEESGGDQGGNGGGGNAGGEEAERDPQAEPEAQDTLSGVTEDESTPNGEADDGAVGSETTAAPDPEAFGEELGDSGSSLPVPIIVLLVVAGVAAVSVATWLIVRQVQARRTGD
jgi:hypothetical protein